MATLTVQSLVEKGVDLDYVAADVAGDDFQNDGNIMLLVKNEDASSHTVTVTAQTTSVHVNSYGDLEKSDAVHAVPAGESAVLGPFPKSVYDDATGAVQMTYDAVTSLSVVALHK